MFPGVGLQSGKFRKSQDQYGPPKNIGCRRWEDMERRWRKGGQTLTFQASQAPGEDQPERLEGKCLCELVPLEEKGSIRFSCRAQPTVREHYLQGAEYRHFCS